MVMISSTKFHGDAHGSADEDDDDDDDAFGFVVDLVPSLLPRLLAAEMYEVGTSRLIRPSVSKMSSLAWLRGCHV